MVDIESMLLMRRSRGVAGCAVASLRIVDAHQRSPGAWCAHHRGPRSRRRPPARRTALDRSRPKRLRTRHPKLTLPKPSPPSRARAPHLRRSSSRTATLRTSAPERTSTTSSRPAVTRASPCVRTIVTTSGEVRPDRADFHDTTITDRGTMLPGSYYPTPKDLSAAGGPASG